MPLKPTADAKAQAIGSVYYEMEQFCEDCAIWVSYGPFLNQLGTNVVLEAMLIHVRALLDFFESEKRGGRNQEHDDVLSLDFEFPFKKVDVPEDTRERLNKEVAHISYSRNKRITPEQKAWQPEWFLPLVDRCLEFIEACQEEWERSEQYRTSIGMDAKPWPVLRIQLADL